MRVCACVCECLLTMIEQSHWFQDPTRRMVILFCASLGTQGFSSRLLLAVDCKLPKVSKVRTI